MIARLAVAALLAASCNMAFTPTTASTVTPASHCSKNEEVLYSCSFQKKVGSVCNGAGSVHYRFGRLGKPDITLTSNAKWDNVRLGYAIGQGGGHQSHVRFTNGLTHYIVYEGEDGQLANNPGRRYSGISVVRGKSGDEALTVLDCRKPSVVDAGMIDAVRSQAPVSLRDQLFEVPDGAFDAWF